MRFTRGDLEAFRGHEVPDLVGPGLRLLFVGINPGLWTAAVQPPLRAASSLDFPQASFDAAVSFLSIPMRTTMERLGLPLSSKGGSRSRPSASS